MLLSEIQVAVFTRVKDKRDDLLPYIIDRKGDGQYLKNNEPFCKVSVVPLETLDTVFCDSVMRSGYIAINCYAPQGYGSHDITVEAEKFIALFYEGLTFSSVHIPNDTTPQGSLSSEHAGWFYVSALIKFEA